MSWMHRRLLRQFSFPIKKNSHSKDNLKNFTFKMNTYIDKYFNKSTNTQSNTAKKVSE